MTSRDWVELIIGVAIVVPAIIYLASLFRLRMVEKALREPTPQLSLRILFPEQETKYQSFPLPVCGKAIEIHISTQGVCISFSQSNAGESLEQMQKEKLQQTKG